MLDLKMYMFLLNFASLLLLNKNQSNNQMLVSNSPTQKEVVNRIIQLLTKIKQKNSLQETTTTTTTVRPNTDSNIQRNLGMLLRYR